MLFTPRLSTKKLAAFCRRVGTALEAGLDIRKVLGDEARRAQTMVFGSRMKTISSAINEGRSVREAFDETHDYFPTLFRELTEVGDRTGHLGDALLQLADHYEYQVKLARGFMVAIAWPLIELTLSIFVIGLLIGILGWIPQGETNFTVFGLSGTSGIIQYFLIVAMVVAALAALWYALRRGVAWTRPIQRLMIRVPMLGSALESLAMARMTWAMHLTFNSGMDTRRAVALSLRTTQNSRYIDQWKVIDTELAAGSSLSESFGASHVFPSTYMDALYVGEQSGNLVESMEKISVQYREQAEAAMKILGVFGFFVAMGLVFAFMIFMIFSLFATFILGPTNEALEILNNG